jgi:hypothetical protein
MIMPYRRLEGRKVARLEGRKVARLEGEQKAGKRGAKGFKATATGL